ncbi:MAG: hypothetical protein AB1592_19300 [Pseudomonadota bacterium]
MPDFQPEPTLFGIKLAHMAAGAMGGIVRSLTKPGGSITRHITTAVVGTVVAGYGTPIGAHFAVRYLASADISQASVEGMTGFVLGLTGMSLCEALLAWIKKWRDGPPPSFPPFPPAAQ